MWQPKVLILGPGGVKGFLQLGSLLLLEQTRVLDDIETVIGVSIGSVIGLLYVIGYKISEIIELSISTSLSSIFSTLAIANIGTSIGLISHQGIREKLTFVVQKKLGHIPTLSQLYFATGINFQAVTTDLTDDKCVYVSHETFPDLSCIEAIIMSINIPLLFEKYELNQHLYVDGGISNPLPIEKYFNDPTQLLVILSKSDVRDPKKNFVSYLFKIVDLMHSEISRHILHQYQSLNQQNCKFILLTTNIFDTVGLTVDLSQKAKMILYGYDQALKFYSNLHEQHPDIYPKLKIIELAPINFT